MRPLCLAVLLAVIFAPMPGAANILVTIDKSTQQMTVSRDGALLYRWPVSTGRSGRDTPNGRFRAFRMERDHYSKEWDDAPMPHSIFFTEQGHAIHGTYEVNKIGRPVSAGCVRLHPENAAKLFAMVEEVGVLKTTVVVTGRTPSAAVARRTSPRPPTDDAGARPVGDPLVIGPERHPPPPPGVWYSGRPPYHPPPPPPPVLPFPWN